jgi:hypothetical protein
MKIDRVVVSPPVRPRQEVDEPEIILPIVVSIAGTIA